MDESPVQLKLKTVADQSSLEDMTEKRKQYLKEYRLKNRAKHREYLRNYLKTHCYYKPKSNNKVSGYFGTTGLGKKYEELGLEYLPGSTPSGHLHQHWDLNWNGKKIEVKVRNLNKNKLYSFAFKKKNDAELALLFCLSKGEISKVLLVPLRKNEHGHIMGMTVGMKSSLYDKYSLVR